MVTSARGGQIMNPRKALALAVVAVVILFAFALSQPHGWQIGPGRGSGFGPGAAPGYAWGHGPMWRSDGMRPGMMWGGGIPQRWTARDQVLSTDDVRRNIERWLALRGNDRLKVGDVVQKDDSTIEATIVTKKESAVVERLSVNRQTGFFQTVGDPK